VIALERGERLPLPLTALLGRDTEVKALRAGCQIPLDDSLRSSDRGESARQIWRSELARAVVDEGACRVLFAGLAAVAELRVPCAGDC
jgi:hypothetical protein